jgi:MYXO-CTERM domain-containing protein
MGYGLRNFSLLRRVLMNAGAKMLRSLLLAGIVTTVVAFASPARAGCVNDVDCPDTACGGQVCDYSSGTPTCMPAGTGSKGSDGWCTMANGDSDCKCKALGAKCSGLYCTFTRPSDAPASGTAGASGGTAGAGTAGAGTAGASGGTAGTSGTAGKAPAPSSGGCSVASSGASSGASSTSGGFAALVGLALVAGRLVRRRRRA